LDTSLAQLAKSGFGIDVALLHDDLPEGVIGARFLLHARAQSLASEAVLISDYRQRPARTALPDVEDSFPHGDLAVAERHELNPAALHRATITPIFPSAVPRADDEITSDGPQPLRQSIVPHPRNARGKKLLEVGKAVHLGEIGEANDHVCRERFGDPVWFPTARQVLIALHETFCLAER
jgi:hypothetical protein